MRLRTGRLTVLAALFFLATSVSALAQGTNGISFQNWNWLGGGARARGMGGAFLGVSDDGTAGTWNPAGLVYNEGILLTMNYSYQRLSFDLDQAPAGQPLDARSADNNFSNLSSATFVSPLKVMQRELLVSVFYNRVADIYTEAAFGADVDPILGAPFEAQYAFAGNIAQAGASFGTVLWNRLSVGASMALVTGDGRERVQTDVDSTRDTASYNQTTTWLNTSDLDYNGLTFTLAALYKAQKWSAGVVVIPPYTLRQSVDYFARRLSVHNGISEYSRSVFGPLHGTDRELDMPLTVGLGGSYELTDNLLLAADYQFRGFNADNELKSKGTSNYRFQESPTEPDAPLEEMPVGWYSLHQGRLGIEYRRETSWGVVPIRLGARNEPLLIGNPSGTIVTFDQRLDSGKTAEFPYWALVTAPNGTGDQVNGWTFSIGSGVHWSQIRLDAALEWTGYSYEESGSLYSHQRCPDCLDTDPDVTNDEWDKRKLFYWGDYVRNNDYSKLRLLLNFTGYF